MSGNRYLLDTNAIIALLQKDPNLIRLLQSAEWVGISVISQIEFLAFSGLSEADRQLFEQFLLRVEIIDLSSHNRILLKQIISIRQQYRLKLPDAIISAMAVQNLAKLVTRDVQLNRVTELTVVDW
ncbi:MAG: type II toxin-antitoxin system VapC family toxin [Xenococcaceae cyanobacterium MO_188.B19]|nr:type II toxin-antitoxin system VapC family toxin [Xenococcaceae cyanobacterium MO_188.B19]